MDLFYSLHLTFGGIITIWTIIVCFVMIIVFRLPEDFTFLGGLIFLLLAGVIKSSEAVAGFSDSGLLTVAALYIVVAGLQETGAIIWLSRHILGYPKHYFSAMLRLVLPIIGLSAFLNNTPVVAMFIPAVIEWCGAINQKPSRFLIPLSYASIFGGMCTLIGTSTNLIVNGLYQRQFGGDGLSMFSVTLIGFPCAMIGLAYLLIFGKKLLPEHTDPSKTFANTNEYILELKVVEGSYVIGKSIENAGLRNLPGAFIVELIRGEQIINAVSPLEIIHSGDRFVFAGNIDSMKSLYRKKGLEPATNQIFKLDGPRTQRCLVKAIVSDTCPLINNTIKEGRFRDIYNAVVIAVSRKGKRLEGRIGDIRLKAGDMLLVECHAGFIPRQKESGDFYLVNELEGSSLYKSSKAPLAVGILVVMVLLAAFGVISMFKAAMAAAVVMLIFKCCTPAQAKRSIGWNVLIVIASTLGLGYALASTGTAYALAKFLIQFSYGSPWIALLIIAVSTTVLTEVITNNGAAAIIFPIAVSTATQFSVSALPFVFCIIIVSANNERKHTCTKSLGSMICALISRQHSTGSLMLSGCS